MNTISSKSKREFIIEYDSRRFELKCSDEANKIQWMNSLSTSIQNLKNNPNRGELKGLKYAQEEKSNY